MPASAAAHPDMHAALSRRLAPLCHAVRLSAAAWIVWVAFVTVRHWSDAAEIARGYGHYLKLDLSRLPASDHAIAFAMVLADVAVAAVVVVFVWRLFAHYLRGEIFTLGAVDEMRRLGWAGCAAVAADIVVRSLQPVILTRHLDGGARSLSLWIEPNDLLHLMMALFFVVLAVIFKTGVEIADDHRQIV